MVTYLKATKTVRAFCACAPKTLRKNNEATVTPDFRISSLVDALPGPFSKIASRVGRPDLREVRDVGEQVEYRTDTQTKRASDFKGPNRILDIIQNVIDVRPAGVGVQDFERGCSVLNRGSSSALESQKRRAEHEILARSHHYCCANFRRTHCGNWRGDPSRACDRQEPPILNIACQQKTVRAFQ